MSAEITPCTVTPPDSDALHKREKRGEERRGRKAGSSVTRPRSPLAPRWSSPWGTMRFGAVGLMPPCGVRARVYPDPAVLGAGLGENIVSITLLQRTRNGHDGTPTTIVCRGPTHIYIGAYLARDECPVSRAESNKSNGDKHTKGEAAC